MSRALGGLHELDLPHIVLEDLDSPTLEEAEMHHLQTVRRLRSGSHLTATDGRGSWSIFRSVSYTHLTLPTILLV